MKPGKMILYTVLGLSLLFFACQDEKGKNDYSGVSDLIADRNKARYDIAKNPPRKSKSTISRKTTPDKINSSSSSTTSKKEELSSVILYEEDIAVVGSKSGRTLAKGVAYINKKGQIVRIKILRE